jgi:hypothetical protein
VDDQRFRRPSVVEGSVRATQLSRRERAHWRGGTLPGLHPARFESASADRQI